MLSFFSHFNPASPTWDLFLILFFVIAAFLYGITVGRARIVVQIVASYMTMAILASAPFLGKLEALAPIGHTLFYLVAFVVVFLALFFLLSRSAFHQQLSEGHGAWWDVLVLSVVQIGFLTSIVLSSMGVKTLDNLSPITKIVFSNGPAPFIWTVLPIGALIAIRGKKHKDLR